MGITKTELFNEHQNRLAAFAKAMGHPARVAIIQYLMSKQSCICNDLVDELPLSQSTISQHLKELKSAGIIFGETEGPKICYCINEVVWDEIKMMFNELFSAYVPNKNCC